MPPKRPSVPLALAALLLLLAGPALAVEVPAEGQCPPYPVPTGDGAEPSEDVVPPLFRPGELIPLDRLEQLSSWLPREVWERRDVFFYEGMQLEVGPCHRRYDAPAFFEEATRVHAGEARLDEHGNLLGYAGIGLPFDWRAIADDAPDAGNKWAWSSRYRYLGSGFRGKFRILHVARRGRKIDRFLGSFYLLPMHGVPGATRSSDEALFWGGGNFTSPASARGVAWRQLHPAEVDIDVNRSDEVWVWIPDERRVRRAPPTQIDGFYTPTYMRGNAPEMNRALLPGGFEVAGSSIATVEHTRIGFTGLILRPNLYRWRVARVHDVLAPINSRTLGYPADEERSYGLSGQSVASDRWDLRRTVVIKGVKRDPDQIGSITLWIDALTQQPLYQVTRRPNGHILEVGIQVGRFSGDDPMHPRWKGSGISYGTILPVASTFYTGRGTGWLRESFELRSDPPTEDEAKEFTTIIKLQRGR